MERGCAEIRRIHCGCACCIVKRCPVTNGAANRDTSVLALLISLTHPVTNSGKGRSLIFHRLECQSLFTAHSSRGRSLKYDKVSTFITARSDIANLKVPISVSASNYSPLSNGVEIRNGRNCAMTIKMQALCRRPLPGSPHIQESEEMGRRGCAA
jgi:hypothetical protein